MTVICDYCGKPAELVTGATIFPHRYDLREKRFWRCDPCGAWVGTHEGTENPYGRLANEELRRAKQRAHRAFDPIWEIAMRGDGCSRHRARGRAYAWLSKELGVPIEQCHIGMFDLETCQRAAAICRKFLSRSRAA